MDVPDISFFWRYNIYYHTNKPFNKCLLSEGCWIALIRVWHDYSIEFWGGFIKRIVYSMKILSLAVVLLIGLQAFAAEFTNLTFDGPDLTGSLRPVELGSSRTPFYGLTSQLLRGWTVLGNGQPLSEITYQPGIGDTFGPVTLARRETPSGDDFRVIVSSTPPNIIDLVIRQAGMVPVEAGGLTFFANGPMQLIVNGSVLYTMDTAVTTLATVDVTRYAGQDVTLDFHVLQHPHIGANFSFDIFGFTQIPEPSTWALFGVGAVALGWAVRQRHSP